MGASPTVLVAGADPLGLAVIERLVRAGAAITALVSAEEASRHRLELERLGARVVVGSAGSPGELLEAGIDTAATLGSEAFACAVLAACGVGTGGPRPGEPVR